MTIKYKIIRKSDVQMVIQIDPQLVLDGLVTIKCKGALVIPIQDPFAMKDVGDEISVRFDIDREEQEKA